MSSSSTVVIVSFWDFLSSGLEAPGVQAQQARLGLSQGYVATWAAGFFRKKLLAAPDGSQNSIPLDYQVPMTLMTFLLAKNMPLK